MWVLDVYDVDSNPLLLGTPLLPGELIFNQYGYLGIPGNMFVQNSSGCFLPPAWQDLGSEFAAFLDLAGDAGRGGIPEHGKGGTVMSGMPQTGSFDQFLHKWGLTVYNLDGGQELVLSMGDDLPGLEQLRIRFEVHQTDGASTPNWAVIRVYNLAPSTVPGIVSKIYNRVTLQAGYRTGRYATIFDGNIIYVKFGKETPVDTFLEIYANDSDLAHKYATVNTTLMPGANGPQDRWKPISSAFTAQGATDGQQVPGANPTQARPTVMYGQAQSEADVLARTQQMVWSIQQGKLIILPGTMSLPGETAVINAATGMVGFPT